MLRSWSHGGRETSGLSNLTLYFHYNHTWITEHLATVCSERVVLVITPQCFLSSCHSSATSLSSNHSLKHLPLHLPSLSLLFLPFKQSISRRSASTCLPPHLLNGLSKTCATLSSSLSLPRQKYIPFKIKKKKTWTQSTLLVEIREYCIHKCREKEEEKKKKKKKKEREES